MEAEVIPAILVKTRGELLQRISQVRGLVREIQIDVMDGAFVPNKTVGIAEMQDLPEAVYEFHWMVNAPEEWIAGTKGPYMHLVHVETITGPAHFLKIESAVKKAGGRFGLAINPETPLERLIPYMPKAERVLVMTVHPGFSGQKYIHEMEGKIRTLRERYPALDIEVDGGVNKETVHHAYSNGANLLAAASAVFAEKDIKEAIAGLKRLAMEGR